ncbi:hypothetical protein ACWEPC_05245 [Nonomuraea sp. NPDC004297]
MIVAQSSGCQLLPQRPSDLGQRQVEPCDGGTAAAEHLVDRGWVDNAGSRSRGVIEYSDRLGQSSGDMAGVVVIVGAVRRQPENFHHQS